MIMVKDNYHALVGQLTSVLEDNIGAAGSSHIPAIGQLVHMRRTLIDGVHHVSDTAKKLASENENYLALLLQCLISPSPRSPISTLMSDSSRAMAATSHTSPRARSTTLNIYSRPISKFCSIH